MNGRAASNGRFSDFVSNDDFTPEYKPQPLDGGYGWVIVFAAFFNFVFVGGSFICFPLIYYEIADYFGEGSAAREDGVAILTQGALLVTHRGGSGECRKLDDRCRELSCAGPP